MYSILGIINLDKISNWEYKKRKSLWVNVSFTAREQIKECKHLSFSLKTCSLNDLLNFSINLINDDNKPVKFSSGEQKMSNLNFKENRGLFKMNRKLRPTKSAQEIQKEQTGFLLEDIERDIAEYKKIKTAKNSYHELTKKNKQLKQYITNIR